MTGTVTVHKDGPRPACEARVGWLAVPVAESLAGAWGCAEPATVTLRGACVHEHVKVKRYCARHGQPDPAEAVWLCYECAELGHDCPLAVETVTAS